MIFPRRGRRQTPLGLVEPTRAFVLLACCLLLTGCPFFEWLGLVPPKRPVAGQFVAPGPNQPPPFYIRGDVRIGAIAGNLGALARGTAMSNMTPLANVTPLSNVGPQGNVTSLSNVTSLVGNSGAALIGNAGSGLIGNAGSGLIGNAGSGLIGNAGSGYRIQDASGSGYRIQDSEASRYRTQDSEGSGYRTQDGGGPIIIVVELVNPATGLPILRGLARADGHYDMILAFAFAKIGLILQATTVSDGQVTGFLAAPVPASKTAPNERRVDISPASTMVLLSAAVASGVRAELRVDTGFRGFKTDQLATMVANMDGAAIQKAAEKIDALDTFSASQSFDVLLDQTASASAQLAEASGKAAQESASAGETGVAADSVATLVAATNVILRVISEATVPAAQNLTEMVETSAKAVRPEDVAQETRNVVATAQEPTVLAATPAFTPAPARSPTPVPAPTPSVSPTPVPAASPLDGFIIRP